MLVPREVTQAILDRLSAATLRHVPSQAYTVADRLEERAAAHPDKVFVVFEGRVVEYGAANAYANRVRRRARPKETPADVERSPWLGERPQHRSRMIPIVVVAARRHSLKSANHVLMSSCVTASVTPIGDSDGI